MKNTRKKSKKQDMKTSERTRNRPPGMAPENLPLEDMVMKMGIQYFGDVLLPFLGIQEPVTAVMPTELIYLEARRLNEDYNFARKDGSWLHLEFESDSVRTEDLRRFRSYEAVASYTYHVPVTTYVICSSTVKDIMSKFTEGINTYQVEIIRLKDWDADRLFEKLFEMKEKGKTILREDFIPVLVSSLMSGIMPTKDRIINGSRLLQDAVGLNRDEILNMQAVLYALANKFLDDKDLEMVKEVMSMTRLGEMLLQDGIKQGIEQGIEQGVHAMVSTLQELGFSHEAVQNKITDKFTLNKTQAADYVRKFWKEES